MKHLRKMIAFVLSMVMALSMNTGMVAFAEDNLQQPATQETSDYDYPLTVTGLSEGDVAHFYQVIKWVGETSDKSDVSGWKAVAPFDTYLTKAKLSEILVGSKAVADDPETPEDESQAAVNPTGITSEIAGELAKLASGAGTAITEDGGTATLKNASSGMWMALIDSADAKTVYNPVFVSADYNKETGHEGTVAVTGAFADAVAKKSTLTLTKTAATTEDTWDDSKSNTTAIGDTVSFTVNTTIPAYGFVYDNPHFVLTDKLTDLVLKADSENASGYKINVTPATYKNGEGEDVATYSVAVDSNKKGYTITFAPGYLETLTAATAVTVTYDAIVTTEAGYAINEEDNDVYIEYSHNPNQQFDYDMKKDTTQHYTFSIDAEGAGSGQTVSGKKTSEVVKIGVDAQGNPITETTETSKITSTETWEGPLQGAVFGLFTDSDATIPYKAKNAEGTPLDTAMTATTGADGRMSFTGLDAGTYYLKEISAPAGYVTNSTIHKIVINAVTKSVKVTEWWNGSEWVSEKPVAGVAKEVTYDTEILDSYSVTIDEQLHAKYTFTNAATSNSNEINWEKADLVEKPFMLENTQGVELPSTGGIGTTIFYIVGGVMVAGAVIYLLTKRRMAAE